MMINHWLVSQSNVTFIALEVQPDPISSEYFLLQCGAHLPIIDFELFGSTLRWISCKQLLFKI